MRMRIPTSYGRVLFNLYFTTVPRALNRCKVSGVSRILNRGVLDSVRAKTFTTTPTLSGHAPQLKKVRMLTMVL